jgi:hypothetical protein
VDVTDRISVPLHHDIAFDQRKMKKVGVSVKNDGAEVSYI